jgi:glycine/D-amino acid oxidase-like deaminating enzyme
MDLDQADVVVVGGGIVGISTAYFLATKGHSVVVVEARDIAYGASGRNMGFLHMHNRAAGYQLDLARAGRALYDDFSDLLGPSFEYQSNGAMTYFFTDEQRQVFQEFVDMRQGQGVKMELLDAQQAREAAPILPPHVIGATFSPEDGQIRTPKFVRALAQECIRLGVRIHENNPALGLLKSGDVVTGVRTLYGDVPADRVVWCAGVWSTMLRAEGVDVPIKTERLGAIMLGQVEERLDKILNGPLAVKQYSFYRDLPSYKDEYFTAPYEDPSRGVEHLEVVSKTENGNLFIGCPMDYPDELDDRMSVGGLKMAIDALLQTFPHYTSLGVEGAWTGLIPATADAMPILDEVDALPGLVVATGHVFGNLAGPITGKLVAELVSGEKLTLPIDELAIDRPALAAIDGVVRW